MEGYCTIGKVKINSRFSSESLPLTRKAFFMLLSEQYAYTGGYQIAAAENS
jgi:hypothetical protein